MNHKEALARLHEVLGRKHLSLATEHASCGWRANPSRIEVPTNRNVEKHRGGVIWKTFGAAQFVAEGYLQTAPVAPD